MVRKNKFLLFFVLAVLLMLSFSFSVSALALSGKQVPPVVYKPGTTFTNSYEVFGSDKNVVAQVDSGGVFKHFSTTPIVDGKFDIILDFPADEYIEPGEYVIGVTVVEEPARNADGELEGGINTLVAVSKKVYIIVYSYEKDVKASLDVPNVNFGSNVKVSVNVASVSYKDIDSVKADLILYDEETKTEIARKSTTEKPLKSLKSIKFTETFDTEEWEAKKYFTKAVVTYDGVVEEVNSTFLIGNMDLQLKDYSKQLTQGYSDFSARVTNNWGNELKNVKAKLFIGGEELLETPTISLGAWQEGELKGIVKVDLKPDVYKGKLKLFYEGESKEEQIEVTVVMPKAGEGVVSPSEQQPLSTEESNSLVFISIAVVVLVIGVVIYFIRKRRGEADDEF